MQFDTFGFTAAELARKQADKEQQDRFIKCIHSVFLICDIKTQFKKMEFILFINNLSLIMLSNKQ